MTTMLEARRAICNTFLEEWQTEHCFDNEPFDPPEVSGDTPPDPWVRLVISELSREQETLGPIGSRRWRTFGAVELHIYAGAELGTKESDLLVELFRQHFEGTKLAGDAGGVVYFEECRVQELGNEGPWWRVNALARFWFEERK